MNPLDRPALAVTSINAIISHPAVPASEMSKPTPQASTQLPPLAQPRKRSFDWFNAGGTPDLDDTAELSDAADLEDHVMAITENCDQIRRKINTFILSGEMKVGEFQKALGVSSKSYRSFLALKGRTKGNRNKTYYAAAAFFKEREAAGIKPVKKKVKKGEEKIEDLSAIKLEGEDTVSVPVYESCDEIRRKIAVYLREPGVTQAAFLREIAKTYPEPRNIQSKVLNDFLGKKGASAGNTSAVFYASYVFFEKLRIKEGKPKSKHRLQMEKEYAEEGGFDTKHRRDHGYVFAGESLSEDKLGKIHVSGRARGGGGRPEYAYF